MCFGHLHFSEHEKLQCPQLAKAITKKPDDLHPAHGSLLYMTIFYIIYTSLSIIYRCKLSARMSKLLTKNDKTMYFKIFIKKDTTFIIFSCI